MAETRRKRGKKTGCRDGRYWCCCWSGCSPENEAGRKAAGELSISDAVKNKRATLLLLLLLLLLRLSPRVTQQQSPHKGGTYLLRVG